MPALPDVAKPLIARIRLWWVLIVWVAGQAVAAETAPRVLVLFSNDRLLPANLKYEAGIRVALGAEGGRPAAAIYAERRQGGRRLHRLLRPAKLHGRPRRLHQRQRSGAQRHDQGRHARRQGRLAENRCDHGNGAQEPGLCHRTVRQEPPGRPRRASADHARLRRVPRQPLPPQRRGGAGKRGLPRRHGAGQRQDLQRSLRPARRAQVQSRRQRRPDHRKELLKGVDLNGRSYRNHLDGYNQLDYLSGKTDKSPRREFIYFNDATEVVAIRFEDWKAVYLENRARQLQVWREPFVSLRLPLLFNLRRDPFERAQLDSNTYHDWMIDRAYVLGPMQVVASRFLLTLKEYPPSQIPGDWSLQSLEKQIKVMTAPGH